MCSNQNPLFVCIPKVRSLFLEASILSIYVRIGFLTCTNWMRLNLTWLDVIPGAKIQLPRQMECSMSHGWHKLQIPVLILSPQSLQLTFLPIRHTWDFIGTLLTRILCNHSLRLVCHYQACLFCVVSLVLTLCLVSRSWIVDQVIDCWLQVAISCPWAWTLNSDLHLFAWICLSKITELHTCLCLPPVHISRILPVLCLAFCLRTYFYDREAGHKKKKKTPDSLSCTGLRYVSIYTGIVPHVQRSDYTADVFWTRVKQNI